MVPRPLSWRALWVCGTGETMVLEIRAPFPRMARASARRRLANFNIASLRRVFPGSAALSLSPLALERTT